MDIVDARTLQQLKTLAIKGSEYGPIFDRGFLHIVTQLESNGLFEPKHFSLLACEDAILTQEELQRRKQLLIDLRMSPEDGKTFARGVSHAEDIFKKYARDSVDSD